MTLFVLEAGNSRFEIHADVEGVALAGSGDNATYVLLPWRLVPLVVAAFQQAQQMHDTGEFQ